MEVTHALGELDRKSDDILFDQNLAQSRATLTKAILYFDHLEAMDMTQQAKVQWSLEGDENTRTITKQKSQLAIKGVFNGFIRLQEYAECGKHLTVN